MRNCVEEVALKFGYPYKYMDEARRLAELLEQKNVKFIFRESQGYYDHEFVVRKSGYKWDDIMGMVNSIYSPVYKKKKTWFNDEGCEVIFVN